MSQFGRMVALVRKRGATRYFSPRLELMTLTVDHNVSTAVPRRSSAFHQHCFVIPVCEDTPSQYNVMNLKAYGTSFRSGAYGSRKRTQVDVTGGCHLCAPHTTPRGDIAYAKSAERLVAHGRSMVLRRSVACAQVVPSQAVHITEGRGANPCATDHQFVCVGQGACALPSQTRWEY